MVLLSAAPTVAGAADATVRTVAGTGASGFAGDGGLAVRAELAGPSGVAVDGAGDVAVADTDNCRVRLIAARTRRAFGRSVRAGHVYTVAGEACGRAGTSSIGFVTGVAFDRTGDLFLADASGNRILELPARSGEAYGVRLRAGHLAVVAGRSAALHDPEGVAVDAAGNLYVADTGGCRVDLLPVRPPTGPGASGTGRLVPVAGTGICGYAGDGGPAVAAELSAPSAVAVDGSGDVLIADEGNSAVREVAGRSSTFYGVSVTSGDIATVAGQDTYTEYLNDGLSASGPVSDVNYPAGLAVDAAGDLFIADSYDRSIREVPARTGTLFGRAVVRDDLYTVVGMLATGGVAAGDGTRWILSHVTYPVGIAVGPDGSLYFSDRGADTVRRIAPS